MFTRRAGIYLIFLGIFILGIKTHETFGWLPNENIYRMIREDLPKFSVSGLIFVSEDGKVHFPFTGLEGEIDIPDGDYVIGHLIVEVRNGNSIHVKKVAYGAGTRYERRNMIPVPTYKIEIWANPEGTKIYQAKESRAGFFEHSSEVEEFKIFGFVLGKKATTYIIVSDELFSQLTYPTEYHLRDSAIRTRGHLPYYITFISYSKAKEMGLID